MRLTPPPLVSESLVLVASGQPASESDIGRSAVGVALLVLSVAGAFIAFAREMLGLHVSRQARWAPDPSGRPLRILGLTTTSLDPRSAAILKSDLRLYLSSMVIGLAFTIFGLIIVAFDVNVSIENGNVIKLNRWLFLIPIASGLWLFLWGHRLAGQLFRKKEGDPAVRQVARLAVDGEPDWIIARCQSALMAVGALRAERTNVVIQQSTHYFERAMFEGQRRRDERVSLTVTHDDGTRYVIDIESATFKARVLQ
jgi:hypothetical protein